MVQGASNKPKTKENQFLNPWDAATIAAYLKDSMANGKIEMDEMEKPLVYPTFLIDPQSNPIKFLGSANPLSFKIQDPTFAANVARVAPASVNSDGNASLDVTNYGLYNPANIMYEVQRTPTWIANALFQSVGPNLIKGATAGKKHRILGGLVMMAGAAAAAGYNTLSILDVAADIGLDFTFYCPTAANLALGTGANFATAIPINIGGNGWLCAAVNTNINVTLTTALTVGYYTVILYGTDE